MDGIYSIRFRGAADWGMGLLVIQNGSVVGTDAGGVLYDGIYKDLGDMVEIDLIMTVPPGATLVQGTSPQPKSYTIPVKQSISKVAITTSQPILLQLPPGPVNVIFQCLRPFGK